MQTSKETVVAIPSGLSRSFAWLLHAAGCWEEPTIPLHSLHMAMYPIWAYLLPCNHRKACRETKWMIRDRAPPANSKQNCVSVQASLSGTSCMLWDGKWATTHDSTIFGLGVRIDTGTKSNPCTLCLLEGWGWTVLQWLLLTCFSWQSYSVFHVVGCTGSAGWPRRSRGGWYYSKW